MPKSGLERDLFFSIMINPEEYSIPKEIMAKRDRGEQRECFQDSIEWMLLNSHTKTEVRSKKRRLDAKLFVKIMPDILESVLTDNQRQAGFRGFFTSFMQDMMNRHSATIGLDGVKKIQSSCLAWEKSLGKEGPRRINTQQDFGMAVEYLGFKNYLAGIIAYSGRKG